MAELILSVFSFLLLGFLGGAVAGIWVLVFVGIDHLIFKGRMSAYLDGKL